MENGAVLFCTLFCDNKEEVITITPNKIQKKHRQEREAVVHDELQGSFCHLVNADKHFERAIHDRRLRDEFVQSLKRAQEILSDLSA